MAAHPIAAYRKVTFMINGVMKNIIVPVPSAAARKNEKATTAADDDEDECVIVDVDAPVTVSSLERSQLLSEQSDLGVDPVEISPARSGPVNNTIDLTESPEKVTESCSMSRPVQNSVTDTDTAVALCPSSESTSGIVTAVSLSHNTSSIGLSEAVPNIVAVSSAVDNTECHLQSQFSEYQTLSASADPVLIAPPPSTEISSLSVISSPRTMTKQEAIAAGWFTEEAIIENNSVSSVELVSLETVNDINGRSTHLALDAGNHDEVVSVMSSPEEITDSYAASLMAASATSGNLISCEPGLELDEDIDKKPHLVANETSPCQKLEKLVDYDCNEDACSDGILMSEEDEPLTAVVEGMDSDNAVNEALTKDKPVQSKKTETVHRRRGRPPKLRLPANSYDTVKKTDKVKSTGGHSFTTTKQYHLKDCRVWLQQLQLPTATVNTRVIWRYFCCRESVPRCVAGSCGLCHGRRISDAVIELGVARRFRAGVHTCEKRAKVWHEFSIDQDVLPDTATCISKQSPSEIAQNSDSGPSNPSSCGNKKYLVIQTDTGTFVVPVESAVGCIVSEQEITEMLSSQTVPSSASCAREFSNATLLAACSQMEQSSFDKTALSSNSKTLSAEAQNSSASSSGRGRPPKQVQRRKSSRMGDLIRSNTLRRLRSKVQVRLHSGNPVTAKKKRLSAELVRKARHSFTGSILKRELRALGLKAGSPRRQSNAKRKTVR